MKKLVDKKANRLISRNEFSKQFKIGEIDLFIHKTFDQDSNLHFIVVCIPFIAKFNASDIKYPFAFVLERDRNRVFKMWDIEDCLDFLEKLDAEITENDKRRVVPDTVQQN
jgi:hypothetical protein